MDEVRFFWFEATATARNERASEWCGYGFG